MTTSRKQEWILAALIAVEVALFSISGRNFFSPGNFFECIRLGVEIGLLALALTPVIVTGGIDLSVGSMMGLCAVTFGALWRDAHLPVGIAIAATLLVSLAGGALNAILISRLNVSPLIVTLGTYSLFRGIAEGVTAGATNYSGFPAGVLYLGQGYIGGVVPTQTIFLVVAAVGFYLLLQRTVIGRALFAIGHSPEGARFAAIPVAKRLVLVYVLSGLAAGVASIIYIAHLGQAKSDAGNGYELIAITAVVLGVLRSSAVPARFRVRSWASPPSLFYKMDSGFQLGPPKSLVSAQARYWCLPSRSSASPHPLRRNVR